MARGRRVSRTQATALLSATDREILLLLSEHRVATTVQVAELFSLPERTARYRLERLRTLGLAGSLRPYAERGSAAHHWYPTRTADAWARGAPIPRGGEREGPNPAFLAHAAAVTGLYMALVRLGPSLGFTLVEVAREAEAREQLDTRAGTTAIVPDLAVVLGFDGGEHRSFFEVDLGTMSLPRLSRKLSCYAAYAREGAWRSRHPYLPALLVLTTTPRRAEAVMRAWEQRRKAEGRRSRFGYAGQEDRQELVVGACDAVGSPEEAITAPVWLGPDGHDGLGLIDLLEAGGPSEPVLPLGPRAHGLWPG